MSGDGQQKPSIPLPPVDQPATPSGVTPDNGAGGGVPDVQSIIRDSLDQFRTSFKEEVLTEARSEAQRLSDRQANRFEKRVGEIAKTIETALTSQGKTLPEGFDVRAAARQQALSELDSATTPADPSPAAGQQPAPKAPAGPSGLEAPGGVQPVDDANAWALSLEQSLGVRLEPADPEHADLTAKLAVPGITPADYKKLFASALTSKLNRVTSQPGVPQQQTPPPDPNRSPGITPNGVPTNPLSGITDPATLISMGLAARRGNNK